MFFFQDLKTDVKPLLLKTDLLQIKISHQLFTAVCAVLILFSAGCDSPELDETACRSSIFEGDVILKTQNDVITFGNTCYTGVDGLLQIGSYISTDPNSITDLTPLRSIIRANNVHIVNNQSLKTLSGLENIRDISESILVYGNPKIRSLSVFRNITNDHVALTIYENESITGLDGLQGIREFHNVDIVNNKSLLDLYALENATRMSCLYIENNKTLTSLNGLENLESVNCLYIWSNPLLTSYCGIVPAFQRMVKQPEFECASNGFNVSSQDLYAGICAP